MKYRSLALTLSLTLALVSCGGEGGSAAAVCTQNFWDGQIGTCLPAGWRVVNATELRERGAAQATRVAFERETPFSGQYPVVVVTAEALPTPMDISTYSEASIAAAKTQPAYEEIDEESVSIDGQDAILHVYAAQPIPDEPRSRFYQVGVASGQQAYGVTGVLPVSVDSGVESEVKLILQNVTLKEQTAE